MMHKKQRKQNKMSNILQGLNKTQVHDGAFLLTESRTYKLWESAGQKIVEAQLTADQINQIFQQVEQGATAGGGNRTMLGKGKDAAGAVKKAYDDLVSKVQNSGPIKGVDAMYDNAAEKLKQATGGDQGVMKYVQKYRDFAKKYPVAQSLIYSALIAAAGISGAGIGGAAALGLFKMVDKLLQGEKFSTAVGKGATTGAMAYGASQLGDYIKGGDQAASGGEVPADMQQGLAADQAFQDKLLNKFPPDQGYTFAAGEGGKSVQVLNSAGEKVFTGDIPLKTMDTQTFADLSNAGKMATPGISSGSISSDPMAGVSNAGSSVTNTASGTLSGVTGEQMASHPAYQAMIQKFGNTPGARQAAMSAAKAAILRGQANESIDLTESQIFLMIGKIVERQRKLDEGIMDTLKGAAGKAVDWAKTKGTNLTTKVTADKLLQAWKKAGSPTDSLDVAKIVQDAGVPSDSIKQVYGTMKIPFAGEKGAGASTKRNIDVDPSSVAPGAPTSASSASAPPATANAPAQAASQAAPAATGSLAQAQELIAKLDPETKTKLISTLKQELSVAESRINELSNEKLGQYKKAASADATAADKAGDYKRGDKRFSGIVKATKKQFANDEKKSVAEAGNNYHDNRTGFTRPKRDLSGEGEPAGMFMIMIDGRPWKEFTSNVAFARAKTLADKNPTKKIQVKWPTGQLNTVTEGVQRVDSLVTDALRIMKGSEVSDAVSALKTVLGDREYNSRRGHYNFYVKQIIDMYSQQGVAEEEDKMDSRFKKTEWMPLMDAIKILKHYGATPEKYMGHDMFPYYDREGNRKYLEDITWNADNSKNVRVSLVNAAVRELKAQQQGVSEEQHSCPHCGGELVSEELMNEKKDACYYKVKSRYKVWPSAYASGALVKCRKKGADSWGNGGKKNEGSILEGINRADESLHDWFNKEKWVRMDTKGNIKGPCAKEPGEGKPKCLPQAKAYSLGKKGRASAAARKRREDPNPERSGKAINVNTKKKSNESIDEGWREKLGAAALTGAMALGAAGAQARVTPGDDPNINRLTGKPNITQPAQTQTPAKAEAPKGFSKEYLQSVVNGTHPRPMISVEKAQELLKQGQ